MEIEKPMNFNFLYLSLCSGFGAGALSIFRLHTASSIHHDSPSSRCIYSQQIYKKKDIEEKHVRNLDMAMASRFASSTLISFPSGLYLICPVGQKCTCLPMIKAYKELSRARAPLRIMLFTIKSLS